MERAYDQAKYGAFSSRPYIDMVIPTLTDPSIAPPGKHILSCFVQYAPYRLARSTWDEQREAFGDAVVDTLAEYAPNIRQIIRHRQVLTPLDLEREFGLSEGNIFHGELTLDQLFFLRPVPGWARYSTPIRNLWMCGSATHPGGGIMGAPGRNAARRILGWRARRFHECTTPRRHEATKQNASMSFRVFVVALAVHRHARRSHHRRRSQRARRRRVPRESRPEDARPRARRSDWGLRDHLRDRPGLPVSDARAPGGDRSRDPPRAGPGASRPRDREAGGARVGAVGGWPVADDLGGPRPGGARDLGVLTRGRRALSRISGQRRRDLPRAADVDRDAAAVDRPSVGRRRDRSPQDREEVPRARQGRRLPPAAMAADAGGRFHPRMVRERTAVRRPSRPAGRSVRSWARGRAAAPPCCCGWGRARGTRLHPGGPLAAASAASATRSPRAARQAGAEIRVGAAVRQIVVRGTGSDGRGARHGRDRAGPPGRLERRSSTHAARSRRADAPSSRSSSRPFGTSGCAARWRRSTSRCPRCRDSPARAARIARSGKPRSPAGCGCVPASDALERAFDAAKYGGYSEDPWIELAIPSILDPGLAPAGQHVVSAYVQFAPYSLRGSTWDRERERLADIATAAIARYAPGFEQSVVARQVITPMDLETHLRVDGWTDISRRDRARSAPVRPSAARLGALCDADSQPLPLRRRHASGNRTRRSIRNARRETDHQSRPVCPPCDHASRSARRRRIRAVRSADRSLNAPRSPCEACRAGSLKRADGRTRASIRR